MHTSNDWFSRELPQFASALKVLSLREESTMDYCLLVFHQGSGIEPIITGNCG
jgi:hypothetical protein